MKSVNKAKKMIRRFNDLPVELAQLVVETHLYGLVDNDTAGEATAIIYSIFRDHNAKVVIGIKANSKMFCRVHSDSTQEIKQALKEKAALIVQAVSNIQSN